MSTYENQPRKKPRITEEQETEILRLKREGKSISDIARAIGCHRQTVRMHLKEKHGDIVAEEARKQVLIEELREHFRELASFASIDFKWRLKASRTEIPGLTGFEVATPGPISVAGLLGLPGPGTSEYVSREWQRMYYPLPKGGHLIKALREHTKNSDLWTYWDRRRKEVAVYEASSRHILQWIVAKTEPECWQKIDPENMGSVQWWLFGNVLLKASGSEQEKLEIKNRELQAPNEWLIARAVKGEDPKDFNDWLSNILSEVETQPEWKTLLSSISYLRETETQKRLRDITLNINAALEGIEIMRAFPGRCHLCPV